MYGLSVQTSLGLLWIEHIYHGSFSSVVQPVPPDDAHVYDMHYNLEDTAYLPTHKDRSLVAKLVQTHN